MNKTNFRVAKVHWYAEIKHSDWLKEVTRIVTSNQITLFQLSVAGLL